MDSGGTQISIAVVTTVHPEYDGRVYERSALALAERGFRVSVVSPWKPREGKIPLSDWHVISGARTRFGRIAVGWAAFRAVLRIRPTVIHFHDLDFVPWGLLLQWFSGAKVVYDVHEPYPEDILYHRPWIPALLRLPVSLVIRVLENFAVSVFSGTIVVVPYLEKRFTQRARSLALVRNVTRHRAHRDLEHENHYLHIGSVSQTYGSEVLLAIGRELRNRGLTRRLVIVDRFADAVYRAQFIACVSAEDLPIDLIPAVRPSDLANVMRRGAVALSMFQRTPTAHLGMHAKFFDHMAFGVPTVASRLENAEYLLGQVKCGVLVEPSDAAAAVDACEAILGSAEVMSEMRENGFRAIETTFSFDAELDRLSSFMAGVAN